MEPTARPWWPAAFASSARRAGSPAPLVVGGLRASGAPAAAGEGPRASPLAPWRLGKASPLAPWWPAASAPPACRWRPGKASASPARRRRSRKASVPLLLAAAAPRPSSPCHCSLAPRLAAAATPPRGHALRSRRGVTSEPRARAAAAVGETERSGGDDGGERE